MLGLSLYVHKLKLVCVHKYNTSILGRIIIIPYLGILKTTFKVIQKTEMSVI